MRAVIDIGTNSVLLLVGRREPDGHVEIVLDRATVSRLGEGVADSRRLRREAIDRTLRVLSDYRGVAEEHGAGIVAVATEGLRLASNREDFLTAAAACLGSEVQVVSGEKEAELSYLSVAQESGAGHLRVIDVGGGSTELVVGEGTRIEDMRSHAVGAVRLTEQYLPGDPPDREGLRAIEEVVRESLATQPLAPHSDLIGLAGTATTTAALLLGLDSYDRDRVDGSRFPSSVLRALRGELAHETFAQRCERPCLPSGRADVIVAGLTILCVAMDHCGAQTFVVRDRGLRYALL
jgi:exopolyphosphatase/guanosine-5'-triphosphate,3'-diphosphate pyrophosphatase